MLLLLSHLARKDLAHSSIKVYLSVSRNLHVLAGLHNEFAMQITPRLQLVLKGLKARGANPAPRFALVYT